MDCPKRRFFMSPYLFSLSIFGAVGIMFCTLFPIYHLCSPYQGNLGECIANNWFALLFIGSLLVIYLVTCIWNAFEFFGMVEVTDAAIVLRAPFRKKREIKYQEIKAIGIDYGWLSVNRQFWIYISKKSIPHQYVHRINRMPMDRETIRIQYSERILTALYSSLPEYLKKQLKKSESILRVYKIEQE